MEFYLINLLLNSLDLWVSGVVARFAGNTRLFRIVKIKNDIKELLENISRLGEWTTVF